MYLCNCVCLPAYGFMCLRVCLSSVACFLVCLFSCMSVRVCKDRRTRIRMLVRYMRIHICIYIYVHVYMYVWYMCTYFYICIHADSYSSSIVSVHVPGICGGPYLSFPSGCFCGQSYGGNLEVPNTGVLPGKGFLQGHDPHQPMWDFPKENMMHAADRGGAT